MVGTAPQRVSGVSGVGGSTALVHEQLLGNESCAQRGVRVSPAKIKADAGGMTAEELKEVTSVCDDKAAL